MLRAVERTGVDRIVLGTAQFGLPYGRRRHEAPLEEGEVERILDAAWTAGVRSFDTAESYGSAAERLARWLAEGERIHDCEVVTKIGTGDATDPARVEAACARFDGAGSITLLSHGALGADAFSVMAALAERHRASAGQSVYTAAEVRSAAGAGATRLQAPTHALDAGGLHAAREAGVPLDARSVFVQGLLLDHPSDAERRVPGAGPLAEAVRSASRKADVRPAAGLLGVVLAWLGPRDRAVVGIDDVSQLEDVAAALQAPLDRIEAFLGALLEDPRISGAGRRLLDPRTWS